MAVSRIDRNIPVPAELVLCEKGLALFQIMVSRDALEAVKFFKKPNFDRLQCYR